MSLTEKESLKYLSASYLMEEPLDDETSFFVAEETNWQDLYDVLDEVLVDWDR